VAESVLDGISAMRLERDGTMSVTLVDGQHFTAPLSGPAFEPTSVIVSSSYLPQSSKLHLRTVHGDDIFVDLPQQHDLAPVQGRPTIYLDQNHWSTLVNSIYEPDRIVDNSERSAATRLVELAIDRQVLLPMSSAHMSETCKQNDTEQRYRRALTITQLSRGWQFRDPLELRRFELRQALTIRYLRYCLIPPSPVTLEPGAVHSGRESSLPDVDADLPPDARWAIHAIRCIGGIVDTMLDTESVPMSSAPGGAAGLQQFAIFLRDNPTGKEMKRRRTHAKFIADLGRELPEEAHRAGITPDNMSDWVHNHSEGDLRSMPALGLFRDVLHEKLSDPQLIWEFNDLVDMMYLTAAAGYCDHVVGEREHTSYIASGLRRLGRPGQVHRNLRSLLIDLSGQLAPT
jgi:hypothetical protein